MSTLVYRALAMRVAVLGVVASALIAGTARPVAAQFDPAAQFSPINNPNGVWSYGFESVPLGSPFNLLTVPVAVPSAPGPAIDSWQSPTFGEVGVFHNGTAAAQTVTIGLETSIFDPGMLAMHAGPNDEFGMVQFTAPANGLFTIQGTFEGRDVAGTTSDVHLLWNNVPVANDVVVGFGPLSDKTLSAGPFLLNAGDTLAYAVGGTTINTMTALLSGAQIAAVPEPSSLVLVGIAIMSLAGYCLRQRFV